MCPHSSGRDTPNIPLSLSTSAGEVMQPSLQHTSAKKHGFTLIELLVVMAIVAVLMTLTVQATQVFVVQAERNSTRATIRKLNGLLRDRIEAYDRAYTGETRRRFIRETVKILEAGTNVGEEFAYAKYTPDSAESALRVLAWKTGFRYYFPQKMSDLTDFEPSTQITGVSDVLYSRVMAPVARQQLIEAGNPSPTATEILAQATTNWTNNHDENTESAELLYYFLLRSSDFGSSSLDGDQFNGNEVADTDGDGLPEFIDRWGEPLRFYRWPTRLLRPAGTGSSPTELQRQIAGLVLRGLPPSPFLPGEPELALRDPEDPVGLLDTFVQKYGNAPYNYTITNIVNETYYHTLETFHAPVIISGGADQLLGMNEPSDTANYGHLASWDMANLDAMFDNIVSGAGSVGGGE